MGNWSFSGMIGGFGYGWGGAIFMAIFWILAIVGLIAVIKWVINSANNKK